MSNPENRLLECLYDRSEGFFALADLAREVGMSPAEIDEALANLRARGQDIEFSPAHGVRLSRPIALASHLIERNLGTRRVGRHAICFAEVDSTNDVAFDAARGADADGLVVLAERQRHGRGRAGAAWLSPPGRNLLFSVLLIDAQSSLAHEPLTVAAGLAAAEGVQAACGVEAQLKWPNDVMLDGAKLAGVLVEVRSLKALRCIVVGVGINVNAAPAPQQVASPAIALAEHLGCPVERTEVAREVLRRLDVWVERIAASDLAGLHDAWVARCGMLNHRVTVACHGRRHTGLVLDVSPMEGLVLRADDGRVLHLPAAAATILP